MTCFAGKATVATPTVATATSVTVLAANGFRKFLMIQNNSAANIAVGLNGETLTGIAPTSTNKCVVLPSSAGSNIIRFDNNFVPNGAITVYQTSGSSINTVTVVEG
jgi:hypothetical protein